MDMLTCNIQTRNSKVKVITLQMNHNDQVQAVQELSSKKQKYIAIENDIPYFI